MNLYLDDDSVHTVMIRLLRQAGHDVMLPVDLGLSGAEDPVHFRFAIQKARTILTHNHHDFEHLHWLVQEAQGHHPGIVVVRRDNDPQRDMKPPQIVRALRNLEASGISVEDQFIILNHWR